MPEGLPVIVTINRVVEETPSIRTFYFDREFLFNPGQFVMVWVPGVDEIPMALSAPDSITVQRVGVATSALFALGPGDRIGIRGPFGNGFPGGGRVLAVAGGLGAAPLLPLAMKGRAVAFLLGARTRSELLFPEILRDCCPLLIATDDGSFGHHGFVIDLLKQVDPAAADAICVCGPERMMVAVFEILKEERMLERSYFSLHRYMKCGIGVCGSCCMDPGGLRVCRDGPVFRGDHIEGCEFGKYARDASGRRQKV
ncbi:MAG TPA: dihydroorotate dehydrogenase electron transfer subunit [Methanoregulaceae archaeon]|nr:dihydroorotate dehydrogenase electron transfer subunit [Methanoregulaceae archaeon]